MNLPDRESPAYAHALLAAQLRMLSKARQDMKHFYSYVIREETTRQRVKCLPHQQLALDFVMENPQSVIRMPVGGSKTYITAAITAYLLGEDPTTRGAIVSSTQKQAAKPLAMVRDYIEQSAELHAVYPALRPSTRDGDPWTQDAITVDRPFGIRDPSLVAVGVGGSIPGARLNWIVVDDILNLENTNTAQQRENVRRYFGSTVLSRLDIQGGGRIVVTNTPWVAPTQEDPGDLTYVLEAAGWPTLTISVWGDVWITNAPKFDSDLIRPANDCDGPNGAHRLVAHDDPIVLQSVYGDEPIPDPKKDVDEVVTFWPDRFTREKVLEIKRTATRPSDFSQNYEMKPRSESEDRIKEEWIIASKNAARTLGHYGFYSSREAMSRRSFDMERADAYPLITAPRYQDIIVCTGVDLAISKKKTAARTVFFTIAVLPPDNRRLILDIQMGRWTGREIVQKAIAIHEAFGSILRVENNTAQDFLLQWCRQEDKSVPIRAHTTGKNKADPTMGVETIFIEIEQGAWLIPCGVDGKSPPQVAAWLQDLRQYDPSAHTGDILMASWFADFQAKKQGANIKQSRQPMSVAAAMYR